VCVCVCRYVWCNSDQCHDTTRPTSGWNMPGYIM